MIVDDTVTYRHIFELIVKEIPFAKVIAKAPNGQVCLDKIKEEKPDIIILDLLMPVLDGLSTLKELRKNFPEIGVIITTAKDSQSEERVMEAMENGAFEFVPKPETGKDIKSHMLSMVSRFHELFQHYNKVQITKTAEIAATLEKEAAHIPEPVVEQQSITQPKKTLPERIPIPKLPFQISIVLIGVSTGGPQALLKVIPRLAKNFPVPILIVQHMPANFTKSFANHLNMRSVLEVVEVEDQQIIQPGMVYVAPGGYHLTLKKEKEDSSGKFQVKAKLDTTPPVNSCRPSADILFKSAVDVFKDRILCLIMTGMGMDGKDGAEVIKKHGGYCITQSEQSCIIYGMPKAVKKAGLSDEEQELENIAQRLTDIIFDRGNWHV